MFIPHTELERKAMLDAIGKRSLEDLFLDVPKQFRFPELNLPPALTEMEVLDLAQELAHTNDSLDDYVCFLGAGAYDHYIPAVVDSLIRRGEFFTAYTPYQPEISQGTLQAIFEYQSLIAHLTGMDVCNASHYDGATAVAEACLTAYHNYRGARKRFVLPHSLHPHYRATIRTYLSGFTDIEIIGDQVHDNSLSPDQFPLHEINENTALVFFQYPDFFGRVSDLSNLIQTVHKNGGLAAVAVNPIALGLLKTPGDFGADIVVGEGQPLGIPLSYGGPYLGIFAIKKELVRKISGRLVGETMDQQGRRGYVLTLTAREQHIRREKASSNICTNQGLMTLATSIYLSILGKKGLKQVAELCYHKAHYAARKINFIEGFSVDMKSQFFNEFVVKCSKSVKEINSYLLDHGFIGGYDLEKDYPDLKNHMLIAVTEKISKELIDLFCQTLKEAINA